MRQVPHQGLEDASTSQRGIPAHGEYSFCRGTCQANNRPLPKWPAWTLEDLSGPSRLSCEGPPTASRGGPLFRGLYRVYGALRGSPEPTGRPPCVSPSRPKKNRPAAVATGQRDLRSVCRLPFQRRRNGVATPLRRRRPGRTCERHSDSPCRRRRSRDEGRPPRCSGTRSRVRTSALLRRSRTCSRLARRRTSSPC